MADQGSKNAAAAQRIITHMNNDHHDSIVRYLEYYHNVSSFTAYNGRISDVSLTELEFSCGGKIYKTPFEPPMTSFREARDRVVEMDKDCVAALNRSDITVKEFVVPHGWHAVEFIIVVATFAAFNARSNFAPASISAKLLTEGFRRFCWTIQPYLLSFMLIVHGLETWNFARTRLRKHNVNVRNPIYWQWLGTTFIEGIGSFKRFDKMIASKRVEKEKQKH